MLTQTLGAKAKIAAQALARATTAQKNAALECIAQMLEAESDAILAANRLDLDAAREHGTTDALLDRISLQKRLPAIIADLRSVIALPDPVGIGYDSKVMPNGLQVSKRRTPLGVLGVIYENRPNVTVDVAALALKSGNAAILRGGSETFHSNMALVNAIRKGIRAEGSLPVDTVQYVESTDRQHIGEMLKLHQYIDMIIPRGGNSLHQFCRENSTIPVITGGIGICHIFVDESADLDAALPVIHNAKTQRPSVCNSLDTVLVHRAVAENILPRIVKYLAKDGVSFRAEPRAKVILDSADLGNNAGCVQPAGDDDFDTEWMALILGLKVVDGIDEAIDHIQAHSLNHSDSILTQDMANADRFVAEVDSSAVFVNASTRFNDGSALGLGAEVAVSTQKLHARGPMALEELTTYKWVIIGDGHIRT
jgi:glutamate-5-semialdehyde dehydrogenase